MSPGAGGLLTTAGAVRPLVSSSSVGVHVILAPLGGKNWWYSSFCLRWPRRTCCQVATSSLESLSPVATSLCGRVVVLKDIVVVFVNNLSNFFSHNVRFGQDGDRAASKNHCRELLRWPPSCCSQSPVPGRRSPSSTAAATLESGPLQMTAGGLRHLELIRMLEATLSYLKEWCCILHRTA